MTSSRLRVVRTVSAAVVASRLARVVAARPPVERAGRPGPPITVVVPARDEAARIGPLLASLREAPDVAAVIVVDDQSGDRTAELAAAAGARVVRGSDPPSGWLGKPWALRQGLGLAATDWVVTLDADVVPDPDLPRAVVGRAIVDRLDLLTVGGRAELSDPPARWLHAGMVAQLVYRFGPPGGSRRLANGQCMVARRTDLIDWLEAVSGEMVEDVALARRVLALGGRVDFLDATDLMVVRPYASIGAVWTGWGRSIGLRGVEPWSRQLLDLVVVVSTLIAPPVHLLRRRGDLVDGVALALRIGTLVGMRRSHADRGVAYWASPLADPLALAAAIIGLLAPAPTWRGRPTRTEARRTSSAPR